MASLSTNAKGQHRILFFDAQGERLSIWLGKKPVQWAKTFTARVKALAASKHLGEPLNRDQCIWLTELADNHHTKLVKVGLAQPRNQKGREPAGPTLGGFIDAYIAGRKDVKPRTRTNYGASRSKLVEFFGESRELASITALDADQFRASCKGDAMSENYTRTVIKNAKLFFAAAVKGKIITENPFKGHKTGLIARPERMEFVDLETTRKVLAACPNAEWKAIFALCRFGGLRCPSEVLTLRWDGIDWERGRLLVRSPKTEHHEGGEYRTIPLFPELRNALSELDLATPNGGEFVIAPRANGGASNLRTTFLKIIAKAGVKPWGKPFQNLRSSRETELMQSHPIHVVTAWMGNTPKVAMENYLQVRDSDFDKAILTQILTQRAPVAGGGGSQSDTPTNQKPLVSKGDAKTRERTQSKRYPRQESNTCKNKLESEVLSRIDADFVAAEGFQKLFELWKQLGSNHRQSLLAHAELLASGD